MPDEFFDMPNIPVMSAPAPGTRTENVSTLAIPAAMRRRMREESTASVSMVDVLTDASRSACIVAGSNPRPRADSIALNDIRGAFSARRFALNSTVVMSSAYPSSLDSTSSLPTAAMVPPSELRNSEFTDRSRSVPSSLIGPLTLPRNPAAGANLPTVTSDSGDALASRNRYGTSPRRMAAVPVKCDCSPACWCVRSNVLAVSLVFVAPFSVAVPLTVPSMGKSLTVTRMRSTCTGVSVTRRLRVRTMPLSVPISPTASTRLTPERRSLNVTSPSTCMPVSAPSILTRPLSVPRRGISSAGTNCLTRRVSTPANVTLV